MSEAKELSTAQKLVGDFAVLAAIDQQRQDLQLARGQIGGIRARDGSGTARNAAGADPAQLLGGNRLRRSRAEARKDQQRRAQRHFIPIEQRQRRVVMTATRIPGSGGGGPSMSMPVFSLMRVCLQA